MTRSRVRAHLEKVELKEPGMIVHAYSPITQDAEAGGLPAEDQPGLYRVSGQPGLFSVTVSMKTKHT